MTSDAFHWYDANVEQVADAYEAVDSEVLHGWLAARLPARGARALDVGAADPIPITRAVEGDTKGAAVTIGSALVAVGTTSGAGICFMA